MTYSCLPSLAIYVYDLQLSLTYRYVPSLAVHVFDLQLSTFSCSWNPSSKWDSSQTECFCWLLWGHLWGRCWSSTSHRCRPSSRQRRCMLQVCTAVSVDHELWAFWREKKAKTFVSSACAQVLFVSISVYTLCILSSHPALFTAITVYTHCVSCLHIALCLYTTAHTLCCLCFNLFLSIPTLPPTLCAPNSHAW